MATSSPGRLVLSGLLAAGLAALIAYPALLRRGDTGETLDPCTSPLAWHVRTVDPRFGFERSELERAVAAAAALWEDARGGPLFRHDTAGSMAIDLVYDERQEGAERRREEASDLAALQARVQGLEALVERRRARVDQDFARHQRQNTRAAADAYEASVDRYNSAVAQYNRAAERYNAAVDGARAGEPASVTAGNLRADTRTFGDRVVGMDRTLTVAVASGYEELVMVMAHELGHALGLGHVADPDALMAAQYREGEAAWPVRLAPADREALAALCGGG